MSWNKQLFTLFGLSTLVQTSLFLVPAFFIYTAGTFSIYDFYIAFGLFCIAFYTQRFVITDRAEAFSIYVKQTLFNQCLDQNAFDAQLKNAAQASSEMIMNAQQLKTLLERTLPTLTNGFAILIGASSLIVYHTQSYFFFTLCVLPGILLPQLYLSKHLASFFEHTKKSLNNLGEYIFETLSQLKTVQALNHQNIDKLILKQYLERMAKEHNQHNDRSQMFFLCYMVCTAALLSGIIFIAFDFLILLPFTTLLACGYLFIIISLSLFSLGRIAEDVSQTLSLIRKFYEKSPHQEASYKKLLEYPAQGVVAIHNVSFAYPNMEHQMVLHDINVSIYPGEFIALVGPSGAGKTTLLNLLMKFYTPHRGKIYLDGINISELEPSDLRSQITLVDQEPELFSASIFENILYGNPSASDADVENLLELIMPEETWQMPKGLRTPAGHRGSNLSIGQKQCVALCRGLLRNTSVFLLDEATSSIDSYSEDLINSNLKHLLQGKTTVMVTHKLAHIEMADRVLMMHSGRIVGFDTHENLYHNNPLYRKLILLEYNKEAVRQSA